MKNILEKAINEMALKQFKEDSKDHNEFMFKHAKIGEFTDYLERKGWNKQYSCTRLNNMQGLANSFNSDVLWVRMKDDYIKATIEMLTKKLDPSIEININYNN
jgi:hypothetical protein